MSSYCLKCRKNTEIKNPNVVRAKNGKIIRDFKDLNIRTAAYKAIHNKAFSIAKDPKYDGYQH